MSLPNVNFLHFTVSEIQAGQTFPTHPDTMGENNFSVLEHPKNLRPKNVAMATVVTRYPPKPNQI